MAVPQFHRPSTVTTDSVRALGMRGLVLATNNSQFIMDNNHPHPQGTQGAVREFLRGQAAALTDLGLAHANNTFTPQPMFAGDAPAAWLRPRLACGAPIHRLSFENLRRPGPREARGVPSGVF